MSSEIIGSKLSARSKSDLIDKVFEAITTSGEEGVFQTELCKSFSLDSRDGSRLVGNLEKQSLITREKALYRGRWTYKLVVKKTISMESEEPRPIDVSMVEGAPCLCCSYQHLCSNEDESNPYSPAKCQIIEEWIVTSFDKFMINQQHDSSPEYI
ncbi:MAG: transcriptional regulator [Candidatus Nitrosocosmicus sp.]|uniref:transcriptional regulator n=1 Tax=Candidatus Nitrosocosmicus agrestis TaxID=2563600 RepID=UPI001E318E83|nr:transcriptional regulator [Candidatus Nitrosocosmicus sp. SS]MDR4491968.1 transcriptional regulator [Candidatus Nitrosocosmicus sp.]HET8794249.1 transcriptional regulator [Nitrososphaeraceae archaeon]